MKRYLKYTVLLLMGLNLLGQNKVLLLDGQGDYVALPQPIIDSETFTIEAWYSIEGDGGGIEEQNFIFAQRAENTGCNHSAIALVAKARPNLPRSSFSVRTDQGCSEAAFTPNAGYGEWHHLAGVLDGQTVKLYRDGNLVATTPYTQQGSFTNNISTVELGRHRHDYQNFGFLIGMIDEVRIWDYALQPYEINERMSAVLTGEEQGLLAYWNFDNSTADDVTGLGNDGILMDDASIVDFEITAPGDGLVAFYPFDGNANDASGNEIHGIVEGATLTTDRFGNENSAYYFNGENDVISLGNDPRLSPDHITVSAWFNSTSENLGSPATQFILRNKLWGYSISFNPYVDLETPHIGGLASVFWLDDGTSSYRFISEETSYNDGRWHYVVASYDGDQYAFYIDGQVVFQDSSEAPGPIHYEPWITTIGRGGDEWANAFEGKIDDIKIYNYALTAEEIAASYDPGDLTQVSVGSAYGVIGENVLVPVNISVLDSMLCRSVELNFSGYAPGLTFIGVETNGTIVEELGWSNQYNESEGVIYTAFAGNTEFTGSGVLCYLEYSTNTEVCTTVPVNVEYAKFNSNDNITSSNGSVTAVNPPDYGDVDENDMVEALDASDILIYTLDNSYLECQALANADVYTDGNIDGMDASIILRYLVQLEASLPVFPSEGFLASGMIETMDQEAAPNASVSIPYILSDGGNIYSFEGEIKYDPTIITVDGEAPINWSPLLSDFIKTVQIDEATGSIKFIGVGAYPDGETGQFLRVNFTHTDISGATTGTDVILKYMKFNSNHVLEHISSHIDVVSLVDNALIPQTFILQQNYPNPFNPTTAIKYGIPQDSNMSIVIYDVRGKLIHTLEAGHQTAGWYNVVWNGETSDGRIVSTGIYFARLVAGEHSHVVKMLYLK